MSIDFQQTLRNVTGAIWATYCILTDHDGAEVLGKVTASPAANTVLGRLKEIEDATAKTGKTVSDSIQRPNNTTNYTAGDVIGTAAGDHLEFSGLGENAFIAIFGARLQLDTGTIPDEAGAIRLHLFSSAPSGIDDGDAFTILSGDRDKYLGYIEFSGLEDFGATVGAQVDNVNLTGEVNGTALYGQLQTLTALEPAAQTTFTVYLLTSEV